jgi:hypothetical protein
MNPFNFKLTKKEDIFYIEPSELYFKNLGEEEIKFIKEINKYSYGEINKFAICRIYEFEGDLYLTHFNNYVREFYTKNKQQFCNSNYKRLGQLLLKNILNHLLSTNKINLDMKIYLVMVDTKNKKLVKFYESLSFIMESPDNFYSDVKSVMDKLHTLPEIEKSIQI